MEAILECRCCRSQPTKKPRSSGRCGTYATDEATRPQVETRKTAETSRASSTDPHLGGDEGVVRVALERGEALARSLSASYVWDGSFLSQAAHFRGGAQNSCSELAHFRDFQTARRLSEKREQFLGPPAPVP